MAKHEYTWTIESGDKFHLLYSFILNQKLKPEWSADDIKRRIIIPLYLGQLISFYDQDRNICGFMTIAFMNAFSASHQTTYGVLPADWRSGTDPWIVDLIANNGDAHKMLREIISDMSGTNIHQVRYFRRKYSKIREVTIQ